MDCRQWVDAGHTLVPRLRHHPSVWSSFFARDTGWGSPASRCVKRPLSDAVTCRTGRQCQRGQCLKGTEPEGVCGHSLTNPEARQWRVKPEGVIVHSLEGLWSFSIGHTNRSQIEGQGSKPDGVCDHFLQQKPEAGTRQPARRGMWTFSDEARSQTGRGTRQQGVWPFFTGEQCQKEPTGYSLQDITAKASKRDKGSKTERSIGHSLQNSARRGLWPFSTEQGNSARTGHWQFSTGQGGQGDLRPFSCEHTSRNQKKGQASKPEEVTGYSLQNREVLEGATVHSLQDRGTEPKEVYGHSLLAAGPAEPRGKGQGSKPEGATTLTILYRTGGQCFWGQCQRGPLAILWRQLDQQNPE